MSTAEPVAPAPTAYAGWMTVGGTRRFLRLTLGPDAPPLLDLPDARRFRVPADPPGAPAEALRFQTEGLVIACRIAGERVAGRVTDGAETGTVTLYREQPVPARAFRRLLGHYALAGGDLLAFGQDPRPDAHLYFYAEGDRVVRIYPIGGDRYVSEAGETLTFERDADGAGLALRRAGAGGAPTRAPRRDWCREADVTVPVADYTLTGTLLLPAGAPPYPAVVLCHHADTPVRDYYRLFAEPFVAQGIAAFIYDKRGSGESTGTPLWSEIAALTADAEAVFRAVQAHPGIRAEAVGLWGISNGAWVAPRVAAAVGDAAFVIGASVAGVTPARQEQVRRGNVVRELGASARAAALVDRLWSHLFAFTTGGAWTPELEAALEAVNADAELQALPKYPGHAPGLQPVPPRVPIAEVRAQWGGTWPEGAFDPVPIYAGLGCPILCVWGAHDTVVPVAESRDRLDAGLRAAGHARFALEVVPDATHHLYLDAPPPIGIPLGTMHTDLHGVVVAPGVRARMAGWARGVVGGA